MDVTIRELGTVAEILTRLTAQAPQSPARAVELAGVYAWFAREVDGCLARHERCPEQDAARELFFTYAALTRCGDLSVSASEGAAMAQALAGVLRQIERWNDARGG